jgi:hypothetical protein
MILYFLLLSSRFLLLCTSAGLLFSDLSLGPGSGEWHMNPYYNPGYMGWVLQKGSEEGVIFFILIFLENFFHK